MASSSAASSRRPDHKVGFRTEANVAETAINLRRLSGTEFAGRFDIKSVFEKQVRSELKNARVNISFLDDQDPSPALVRFSQPDCNGIRQVTLEIKEEVWRHLSFNDPYSRRVLAHEIGHMVLGHHHATPFSDNPDVRLGYAPDEYSAEWQADTFTKHFLLPDLVVKQFDCPGRMAEACDVPEVLARERFATVHQHRARLKFEGEVCPACANFTLVRSGTNLTCDTCRLKKGMLVA